MQIVKKLITLLLPFILLACESSMNLLPNIIFILTDDQRDNTLGAMGNPFVKTPNMDKLVQNGIRFSNTYIAEPVCSPSRISLFIGMHERIHGIGFTSSYDLTEEQWETSYPSLLRKNGYFTGFIGKLGIEHYTFRGEADSKFDYWWGHDGWTKFLPKNYDYNSTRPYHKARNDIITPIMGEAIEDFLNNKSTEKPFCLSVSINVPHGSQTTSMYEDYEGWHDMSRPANENPQLKGHPIYDGLYRDIDIRIPSETTTDPYEWIPREVLDQEGRMKTYSYDYNIESCQEHHIRYYQTITGLDIVIGELMKNLENRGLADNTIIIFASDHGLIMGEYGMGGKSLLYDLASKIPCFIYDPRLPQKKRGKTIENLVSSLDLTTTILDYAGIKPSDEMTGNSLVPLVKGKKVKWRDELFLESLYTGRDNPFSEGIRKGDWKYIRMYDGVENYKEDDLDFKNRNPDFEQLFNLKDDPMEMNNLISEYEENELLEEFRKKTASYSQNLNSKRAEFMQLHEVALRKTE
ncbi:sulfatase-like hydrolase/transferase [Bacteroidota bacterium]